MDTAFRKIDIDVYDEDAFLDSELFEPDPRAPDQVLAEAKQKQTAVRSSLAKYVVPTLDLRNYGFTKIVQERYGRGSIPGVRECTIWSRL